MDRTTSPPAAANAITLLRALCEQCDSLGPSAGFNPVDEVAGLREWLRTESSEPSINTPGLALGVRDRNGTEVHVGDIIEFDSAEWGGERIVRVEFENGELSQNPSEIPEWCTVLKKWSQP